MSKTTETIEAIAIPLANELELEIVDVEFVKEGSQYILRVLIDREGGITLDHCVALSRVLDADLDRIDPIEQNYVLEVSSPGIERPLKKAADFLRFAGKPVEVKLFAPLEGRKKIKGTLRGFVEESVVIEEEDDTIVRIPLNAIAKANLAFI